MNDQTLQKKLAWQTAYQLRSCPNDHLLFSGKAGRTPEMAAHLAICSFCHERLELTREDRSALAGFFHQVGSRLPQALQSAPKLGQVWTLSERSAGWGGRNRHYNPPRVLLLEAIPGSNGYLAAQIFSEKALMGPGDVWLDGSFGFAEAWNSYSVHAGMLEACWGEVPGSSLREVHQAAAQEWEPSPADSLLQSFRQMEVAVASFFSMQAVALLTAEYEAAPELSEILAEAMGKIKAFVRELTCADLKLLEQNYEMAGATRGASTIDAETVANLARLNEDEAVKLLPVESGQFKGARYKLQFRDLSWLSSEPLPVRVTVRGKIVENVQWEHWGSDKTCLVLYQTTISQKETDVEGTFLSIAWSEKGLDISILP